uniref:Metalloendopeptidase n=1 Tax=Parascaris univalens TaxID=6257 RepID=A0A915BIG8_PARUN
MLYEMNTIFFVVSVAVLPVWGDFTIEQLKSERFAYTVEARDSGLDLSKVKYHIGDMVFDRNPFKGMLVDLSMFNVFVSGRTSHHLR